MRFVTRASCLPLKPCVLRLQELSNYLLQLVQALRYETKYPSDLSECAQPALLTQQVG